MDIQSNLLTVVFFSLIGGVFSLIGGAVLLSRQSWIKKLTYYATPFAAGALLAAAFGDLLTEAVHETGADGASTVFTAALAGILVFFILEKFLRWFHHHHEHENHNTPSSLIIIGDVLHNALDGVAIAAAFLTSPSAGIVVTLAVAAHEIPQEIGDFGLLLKNGMSRKKVLLINLLSALSTVAAAAIVFLIGDANNLPIPVLLGVTAGFFIYIAASDIIPEIHESSKKLSDIRPLLVLVGVIVVMAITNIAHSYIETEPAASVTASGESSEEQYKLSPQDPVPSVDATVSGSEQAGMLIHVKLENFRLSPENDSNPARPNEGHVVLLADGKILTRIYSEWAYLPPEIVPESEEFVFRLAANDHRYIMDSDGTAISRVVELHHEDEADHDH
ncbi:MAG: ZIP family metal transporter [bacterium]|nr:ZIP family metal transporter [bacterium]